MRYWYPHLAVFLGALAVPAWWLCQAWIFALGPDPGKTLVGQLGLGVLVLLLFTLVMTPLQKLSGQPDWIAVRCQLGLWCFTYVLLHLSAYCVFILGLDWEQLGIELSKRPYTIVGMLGLVCLFLLAITSNRFTMCKLGSRWKKLYHLVYLTLGLGLLHMLWVVRADLEKWILYAVVGAPLMPLRLPSIACCLFRLRTRPGAS